MLKSIVNGPPPVVLAPMSGVSDLPFRRLAHRLGASLVVSEMIAGEELVRSRADVLRRAEGRELTPFVIQLAGREEKWMAEGARIAEAKGAQVIDINMGCPAREVTGKLSGSALMRNLDHAQALIRSVVSAVSVPVTLKMRLGWDDQTRNAPEQRAELAASKPAARIEELRPHARIHRPGTWESALDHASAHPRPITGSGLASALPDVGRVPPPLERTLHR